MKYSQQEKKEIINLNFSHLLLKNQDENFILNTHKKIKKVIRSSELVKIEADGSYSKFYLADGTIIMNSYNIAQHEKKLTNPFFIRIHKSFIINICYVSSVTLKSPLIITLRNSEQLIASRRKEKLIRFHINKILSSSF